MTSFINTRPIPSTAEALPVIGCGTYIGFDAAPGSSDYAQLPGVLETLFAAGGSVLDSSPMYGRAEATTGELLAAAGSRPKAFIATKVWTSGREAGMAQIEQSFARLQTDRIDLLQVHNLLDWRIQLATLRRLKEAGRVRHIGISHYTEAAFRKCRPCCARKSSIFCRSTMRWTTVRRPNASCHWRWSAVSRCW